MANIKVSEMTEITSLPNDGVIYVVKPDGTFGKIKKENLIESVDPATPTTAGVSKLYNSLGANTDGAINQKYVSEKIASLVTEIGNLAGSIPTPPTEATITETNNEATTDGTTYISPRRLWSWLPSFLARNNTWTGLNIFNKKVEIQGGGNLSTDTAFVVKNLSGNIIAQANGDRSWQDSGGYATGFNCHADSYGGAGGFNSHADSGGKATGYFSNASGDWAFARSYSETVVGCYNDYDNHPPQSADSFNELDLIFSIGIGQSIFSVLNAFSVYKNGMFKFVARELSNITNAVKGSFAVDENGRPYFHNGIQWNKIAYSSEANASAPTFSEIIINSETDGIEIAITGGTYLVHNWKGTTIYRFLSTATNANGYNIEDSFYSTLTAGVLSNKIVQRNQ